MHDGLYFLIDINYCHILIDDHLKLKWKICLCFEPARNTGKDPATSLENSWRMKLDNAYHSKYFLKNKNRYTNHHYTKEEPEKKD